ncbi:hypothetical protein, partial [Actinophytocola sp.]|uniref:hypothetical protein n=1 Tax=Actinophytocola sp. TaxID=1872138 RepID=UPI00389AF685
ALEALPLTTSEYQLLLLNKAFSSGSPMLREEAYRQLGGLPMVPDDLGRYVRRGLVTQWLTGALRRPRLETVRAWVRRADPVGKLARTLRLQLAIPYVDAVLALGVAGLTIWTLGAAIPGVWAELALAVSYVAISHLSLLMISTHPRYSWSPRVRLLVPIQVVRNAVTAVFRRQTGHSYRVLGLLVRVSLLVPLAMPGVRDSRALAALAVSAFLLMWPLSALRIVVNDRMPHIALLPLLPAVNAQRRLMRAGAASGRAVAATGRGLYRHRRGIWEGLKGLGFVVLFLGGIAALGLGLTLLSNWITGSDGSSDATPTTTTPTTTTSSSKQQTSSSTSDVDWPLIWTIAGGVVAAVVLALVARHLVIVIRDTRVAHAVGRALPRAEGEVEVAHIIKVIESARSDRVLLNCIAELKRRGMLQRAERVVTFLSDLAATSERSRTEADRTTPHRGTAAKPRVLPAPNCGQDFRDWFTKGSLGTNSTAARRARIVRSLSEEAIDEIARVARLRPASK